MELLLSLTLKWAQELNVPLDKALGAVTVRAAKVIGAAAGNAGQLALGTVADLCVFDPAAYWVVTPAELKSQGRHTPFSGLELPGVVRATVVGGRLAYQAGV